MVTENSYKSFAGAPFATAEKVVYESGYGQGSMAALGNTTVFITS